jgi:hypothetical protein
MQKTLDTKLERILEEPSCGDFILADAKDPDLAFGIAGPGKSPEHYAHEGRYRSQLELREIIRQNVQSNMLDIVLMSASTSEILCLSEKLFENSPVTPAARANDTTDIWLAMGTGRYGQQPSKPFRTATIDHIMCGKQQCTPQERSLGTELGLYSVTFNNDTTRDRETLEHYKQFRLEAEQKNFRHFLEVFNPNACGDHCPTDVPRFINDQIARTLGGVTSKGRPIFLKIPYHGPAAMEQLASYDRTLIPGILGGSSGTTYDAFHQLWEAKKYGARAALYGRMINNSEHQLTFIQHLRWIADGQLNNPAEAVRSYHSELQKLNIQPYRSLQDDLSPTLRQTAYSTKTSASINGGAPSSLPQPVSNTKTYAALTPTSDPNFEQMTQSEKVAWQKAKWDRVLK